MYRKRVFKVNQMEKRMQSHIGMLLEKYPKLASVQQSIKDAYAVMAECYRKDGKLLVAGNGGSSADAEHIVAELMKKFRMKRPVTAAYADRLKETDAVIGARLAENLERGLMAIPLTACGALATAYMNDVDGTDVFAQQLFGYGRKGDVFLGISTSGSSTNIISAAVAAKAGGMKVIGLTGADGGWLAEAADVAVKVPETETYLIQELHLPVYHCWCMMLEETFFGMPDYQENGYGKI